MTQSSYVEYTDCELFKLTLYDKDSYYCSDYDYIKLTLYDKGSDQCSDSSYGDERKDKDGDHSTRCQACRRRRCRHNCSWSNKATPSDWSTSPLSKDVNLLSFDSELVVNSELIRPR